MNESRPQAASEQFLRFLLALFVPLLIVSVTLSTPDPAMDIKRMMLAWGAGVLGIGWILMSAWFRIPFRRPPLFFALLGALLLLQIIAMIPSEFPWIGALAVGRLFTLFVIYVVVSQIYHDVKQIRLLLLSTCIGMLLASAYAYLQAAGLDPVGWGEKDSDVYRNLPSFFGHPNFAAHALVFVIPFAIYLALTGWRSAALFAVAFFIYLEATDQRGAWIGLAGALTLLGGAWLVGRRQRNPVVGVLLSLGGAAVAGMLGLAAAASWSLARTGVAFPIEHSLLLRYQSYVSAGQMFFERPFLGHGPGVYGITNPMYWSHFEQEWFAQERRMNAHVHNDLIEFGIDAGMLGSGLYLALLLTGIAFGLMLAFRSNDAAKRALGYLFAAVFAAFAIDGLFGFGFYVPVSGALFFVSMGLLDALHRPAHTEPEVSWAPALRWALGGLLVVLVVFESRLFSARQDLQSAGAYQAANRFEEAEALLQRGLGKAPWDWDFDRQIGHVRASQGDFDGAIEAYESVVKKNPYYILTRLPLAHAKMRRAQLALRENPNDTEGVLAQLDNGAEDLKRALEICPMLPEAHQIRAEIAGVSAVISAAADGENDSGRALSYWAVAEDHLNEAVTYKLDNMDEMYRQLAYVRVALNDLPGAERALTEAVRRDPHNTSMWPAFMDYVLKFRRFDQARNVIQAQIRELEAETPPDKLALTTTKLFLGNILENGYTDLDAAQAAYREATVLGPERPEVWTNFARFARQRGRMDEFRTSVLQTVQDAGESARELLPGPVLAADLYLRTGVDGLFNASSVLLAAVRSYQASTEELNAQDAAGWAVDLLQEGVQSLPIDEHCLTVFNIGLCRNALKQYELARGLLQLVDECIPQDQADAYALHYADTLTGFGQPEEALRVLEQAVNVNPQNLELRWALARNLSRMQQFDRAKEIYDALLAEAGLDFQGKRMLEQERNALP